MTKLLIFVSNFVIYRCIGLKNQEKFLVTQVLTKNNSNFTVEDLLMLNAYNRDAEISLYKKCDDDEHRAILQQKYNALTKEEQEKLCEESWNETYEEMRQDLQDAFEHKWYSPYVY